MSRRKGSKYVITKAEESSEEEDYDSFVSETFEDAQPVIRTKSYREFAAEMEEKYTGVEEEEEGSEEGVVEVPDQSRLLPTSRSPLLFLLRCKSGKERAIQQKVLENAKNKEIFSIIQKDGLKGFLYVEAFRKQVVEDCLVGVNNVSKNRISVVPLNEMAEVMTYRTDFVTQEFARVKGGKYKGDLVQVLDSHDGVVKIKAIPRLETQSEMQNKKLRPTQRLFNPAEHPGQVLKRDGGYYYNRDFYKEGFLIKHVLWQNLDFDVDPTFAELEALKVPCRFSLDDSVQVNHGDLKGSIGKIREINGNIAVVESGTRKYEVPLVDLEKYYAVGTEMSYNDQNGIILFIKNGEAVLGINDLTEEVRCRVEDLKPPVVKSNVPLTEHVKKPMMRVRRDPLLNKPVVIGSGRYRGCYGTVKDVHRGVCRVQLSSSLEYISVDVGAISELSNIPQQAAPQSSTPGSAIGDWDAEEVTAAVPKTPGYKTPGYRTPGYKTPTYKATGDGWEQTASQQRPKFYGTLLLTGGRSVRVVECRDDKFIMEDGKEIEAKSAIFCAPEKYDNVIIMSGPGFGVEGALVSVSGDKGTVRTQEGDNYDVDIRNVSKKEVFF